MSIIEKALRGGAAESAPLSVPDALASILVAAVTVDGMVHPDEAMRINGMLATSNILRQAGNGAAQGRAERAIALLSEYGLPAVLTGCAKVIPADLRPTAFALATDLVFADGRIGNREKAFIDELQVVLQIDDATALKIVDVMLIKNRS
jgi:hypothetical protein